MELPQLQNDLIKNLQKYVGKEVILTGKHPAAGEKGKTIRVKIDKGNVVIVVKLDNGGQCYVDKPAQLKFTNVRLKTNQ